MDQSSKSVWGASEIIVGSDYNPGGARIVVFGKTARKMIQQGFDELGRWSWMALEGEDNRFISIMSIYQCCKNVTNPQGKTVYHQQETMLSERNRKTVIQEDTFTKICVNSSSDSKRK